MAANRPLTEPELQALYNLAEARALSRVPALATDGRLGMRAIEELRALRVLVTQLGPLGAVVWDTDRLAIRSIGGEQ